MEVYKICRERLRFSLENDGYIRREVMKQSKENQKVSKKDFLKNILITWQWFLFILAICAFFAFFAVLLVTRGIKERIEIAQKAPAYEVVEGEILSVDVKKYYSNRTKSSRIPDKKYIAVISYIDEMGQSQQLRTSEVDKKLKVGKKVKVVYNPEDEEDADIAYFDILVFSYVPCYLKSFKWYGIILIIMLFLVAYTIWNVFIGMIKECAHTEHKAYKKSVKTELTREQLRTRRNLCIIMQCMLLPLCIFMHYSYLSGNWQSLIRKANELMGNWPVVCKQIMVGIVCYSPSLFFYGLRKSYEYRRQKINN